MRVEDRAGRDKFAQYIFQKWCQENGMDPREWKTDAPWDSQSDIELCEHERDDYRAFARLAMDYFNDTIAPDIVETLERTKAALTFVDTRVKEILEVIKTTDHEVDGHWAAEVIEALGLCAQDALTRMEYKNEPDKEG